MDIRKEKTISIFILLIIILICTVNVNAQQDRVYIEDEEEFMEQGSGEIVVEANKKTVYINSFGEWKWTLRLYSRDSKQIELRKITQYLHTYNGEYRRGLVSVSADFKEWWGSNKIDIADQRTLRSGIGNPEENDIYFIDYYLEGIDEDGQEIEGRCRVSLIKEFEAGSIREVGFEDWVKTAKERETKEVKENPDYDTKTLRHNADFRVKVAEGVYWVPANILGKSNLSFEKMKRLGNKPLLLKEYIDTLYEVIQYLQLADFRDANDNIRISEGKINWEHHKPGEMAITTNQGCCATSSNLLNYLLEGDYDQVGFMGHSQKDGSGHVYNYIKEDGKFYLIDLTHYRNDFMDTAVENGSIGEYLSTDSISGNIHQVEDFLDYVNYCLRDFNEPPVVFSTYMAENVLPIDSIIKGKMRYILYPDSYQDKVNIVYENEKDNVRYGFASAPEKYPEVWEPYNTIY